MVGLLQLTDSNAVVFRTGQDGAVLLTTLYRKLAVLEGDRLLFGVTLASRREDFVKMTTTQTDERIDANSVEETQVVQEAPQPAQHASLTALRQFAPSLSLLATTFLDVPDFLKPLVGGGSHHG